MSEKHMAEIGVQRMREVKALLESLQKSAFTSPLQASACHDAVAFITKKMDRLWKAQK